MATQSSVKVANIKPLHGPNPQRAHQIDISTNAQKEDWFLEINPNGRIPAITDTLNGETIRIFESGSILQYLVDQYDTQHQISYPRGTREAYEVNNWLIFQNAGVGPMQGQANHFMRYAPKMIKYGIDRYVNETRRLYRVLDTHLAKSPGGYLVGDKCRIADITHIGWLHWAGWAGVDQELGEFPHLKKWNERMFHREVVRKGNDVPVKSEVTRILGDKEKLEEYAKMHTKWIQKGMSDDKRRK